MSYSCFPSAGESSPESSFLDFRFLCSWEWEKEFFCLGKAIWQLRNVLGLLSKYLPDEIFICKYCINNEIRVVVREGSIPHPKWDWD